MLFPSTHDPRYYENNPGMKRTHIIESLWGKILWVKHLIGATVLTVWTTLSTPVEAQENNTPIATDLSSEVLWDLGLEYFDHDFAALLGYEKLWDLSQQDRDSLDRNKASISNKDFQKRISPLLKEIHEITWISIWWIDLIGFVTLDQYIQNDDTHNISMQAEHLIKTYPDLKELRDIFIRFWYFSQQT